MYRIIILLGTLLAFTAILSGVLTHLPDLVLPGSLNFLDWHNHIARVTSAFPVVLFLLAWKQKTYRVAAVAGSLFLLFLLVLQVAAGVFLLKDGRFPVVKTGHLLLASWILATFFWMFLRAKASVYKLPEKNGAANFARFGILLVTLQIALGGWVHLIQAGMACSGFPDCNAKWWPDADYRGAWANLISHFLAGPSPVTFEIQVAVNWLHRLGALVCFVLLNGLMLGVTGPANPKPLRSAGLWLSFLLFVQVGLGVIGYKFNMPFWITAAHSVFAPLLLLPLVAIGFYSRYGEGFLTKETETSQSVVPVAAREALTEAEAKSKAPPITPTPVEPVVETYSELAEESIYQRLKSQLAKTRGGLGALLSSLPLGQKAVTDELLEDIEASLLMADVGVDVATKIINHLRERLDRHQLADSETLIAALKADLLDILQPCSQPLQIPKQDKPFVILVVGVNGVGKTTTIGKLAKRLTVQGHNVMLAAGDTFRAAAVEQLQVWGQRNNIPVIAQQTGADSASVIFDAIQSAQAKQADVLIADTAGRLHTKSNLMEELKKVKRIMAKLDETAPHEVLLVLDAGTGQNALSQAKQFNAAINLTGLVLTKLDGTAKGGVIFALAKQCGIPIRFIGVGEGIEDLQDFNAESFINALFVEA